MDRILTYDSTLRDGEQCEGVSLSLEDKLRIVARLDEFGIDFIEGGFPASNPKDIAFFQRVRTMSLKHAQVAAFGSTCKKGVAAADDQGLADLLASKAPVVTIVGKTWDEQVTRALLTTLEENLRMIGDSVAHLKGHGRRVVFDAEHFFDGYKANPDYALACVRAASEAVRTPSTSARRTAARCRTRWARSWPPWPPRCQASSWGIHCHNDSGCAVANTLAAVRAGATQVQGTVNGFGERVGNTDLLTVVADLELKMGCTCVGEDNLRDLTSVSQFVAEACNLSVPAHHPYTGASAFAHKGGLHASAIARFPEAYEHTRPESVGNVQRMLVSELAGKASLVAKAGGWASAWTSIPKRRRPSSTTSRRARHWATPTRRPTVRWRFCCRAIWARTARTSRWKASASSWTTMKTPARLRRTPCRRPPSRSTWGDRRFVATGEGAGPVGALDNALRMAIVAFYPPVADMELVGLQGAHPGRERRAPTPSRGSSSPRATSTAAGAPWACPRTSSRLRGTRWLTRSNTAS